MSDRKELTYPTGAHGVAAVIAQMDQPTVYGHPGGHAIQIFDALRDLRETVDCVLVREESLGTVMAEAQGRLTGRPAVVLGQGAWVLGNAGIGIMEAHLGSSPMVILVDATEGGSFSHHGYYQVGMAEYGGYKLAEALSAITKRTFVALDPVQAVQMTQLAVKHATTGEPGPVAVVFHSRALQEQLPANHPRLYESSNYWKQTAPSPEPASVEAGAALIRAAHAPVILSGGGVRIAKAEAELKRFSLAHNIPVATTAAGKGTIDERGPLAVGVIGSFGHDPANRVVGESDLIIAVGTKLSAFDTAEENPHLIDPTRQRIVHIDIEALNVGWTTPVDAPIVADAKVGISRLDAALGQYDGNGAERVQLVRELTPSNARIGSGFGGRAAVAVLNEVLPSNTIVTCDAGENRLFMVHDYLAGEGGTVLQPNGGGGMGYAVPAAIAASRVGNGRPAVAVCGDGGFAMTLHGLMTAVEIEAHLIVVVLDNHSLGWVLHGQGDRPFMTELRSFDLAGIAEAIGCFAVTATDEAGFRAALKVAVARTSGVSVVIAKTTLEDSYLDVRTALAAEDVEAVKDAE